MLPIVLPAATVAELFKEATATPGYKLKIDLDKQVVIKPAGEKIPFEINAFRKHCLLNGLDDIGLTLQHEAEISRYEKEHATV
jgi:3-isopropylmalate/(R)-2-methylmalate dehydratase small subunit